ncbi:MAG: staygreen family protein [Anaerolineales bacterium]|nr:staygreen family protein [Anaerolineales bacterium]
MSELNPNKLSITFMDGVSAKDPIIPRAYTLTHSDTSGDLYLSIGQVYNNPQIFGWYTRLMRDEVLAEWQFDNQPSFHVHCHVSGSIVLGSASWRYAIFCQHMRMVLEAFRFGDNDLFEVHPNLDRAKIWVHFHSKNERYNKIEEWGQFKEFRLAVKELTQDR